MCQGQAFIKETHITVDSKKLEHGCRMIYAGVPSFFGFGVGGRLCSNFLASTASPKSELLQVCESLITYWAQAVSGDPADTDSSTLGAKHPVDSYV